MIKTSTHYVAHDIKGHELSIEVNNESAFSNIKLSIDNVWRDKIGTIKYLEWCIEQIKILKK